MTEHQADALRYKQSQTVYFETPYDQAIKRVKEGKGSPDDVKKVLEGPGEDPLFTLMEKIRQMPAQYNLAAHAAGLQQQRSTGKKPSV